MANLDLAKLRSALAAHAPPERTHERTPKEERVIAGFEDIVRFVDEHGRAPQHGDDRDIFERIYAVRLARLRALPEFESLLAPMDKHGLLKAGVAEPAETFRTNEELRAILQGSRPPEDDITNLRHVRSRQEIQAAEVIANRKPCEDFDLFKALFETVRQELKAGIRESRRFREDAGIRQSEFFILGGQMAYVASAPTEYTTEHGHAQGRLRVIFDNGTESDPLLRSFQRALYKDEAGRRITDANVGPLFGDAAEDGDLESGTIYVLQSLSDDPYIAAHRQVIHKIGVTGGDVKARLANAPHDATYLLAGVTVVAEYKLFGINRTKLEALLHRVLAPARLDVEIKDRFGNPVKPREWFVAPLPAIDEIVEKVRAGALAEYVYDPASARLVRLADAPNT